MTRYRHLAVEASVPVFAGAAEYLRTRPPLFYHQISTDDDHGRHGNSSDQTIFMHNLMNFDLPAFPERLGLQVEYHVVRRLITTNELVACDCDRAIGGG